MNLLIMQQLVIDTFHQVLILGHFSNVVSVTTSPVSIRLVQTNLGTIPQKRAINGLELRFKIAFVHLVHHVCFT